MADDSKLMAKVRKHEQKQAVSKDAFHKKFSKVAEDEHRKLIASIEKQNKEASDADHAFRKALQQHITAALPKKAAPNPSGAPKVTDTLTVENLLSGAAQQFERARNILEIYNNVCQAIEKSRPSMTLGEGWDDDFEQVLELLELGKRVARRHIEELEGKNMSEPLSAEDKFKAVAQLQLRPSATDIGSQATFHDLLKDTERGISRITRGLLADEVTDKQL